MEWSIQQIARLAGTTSRTLRHYGEVGLVTPSRIGDNEYRYYDAVALVRLQRVLLLRELGLGIPAIAEILAGQRNDTVALRAHLEWLTEEKKRLDRLMTSVSRTIHDLEKGEEPMAEKMFDGFDHTVYKDEVEEKWGAESYAASDRWYTSMSQRESDDFLMAAAELASDWASAAQCGAAIDGPLAQELAKRQCDWLCGIPGAPKSADGRPTKQYFSWLGDSYVNDERFAVNYGGTEGATFVRDAMRVFAEAEL
ncbi:MerR family transcriptional regulator [Subtercola frigoramans]|uniref:DNA-binding transcriptional MerR regulator n=1 Tax=Subtercola frigoramans TaxID=120298 RepID=A0ABS2L7L8_9MICO|nr:MerR family transcriptional regulator [Subtercola frigoramans]MBM7472715.1 DNA-binding transcriptional MerR regulator [Subtercola frigoramans]